MADGTVYMPAPRGSRPINAGRVAALRAELDPTADFAEDARRTLADLVARLDELMRDGDLAPCRALLARAQARLEALSPDALTPKGWFDSRGRRLKVFRRLFATSREACAVLAADLDGHCQAAARRNGALGALWNEVRDAVAALDVPVAAAIAWLTDQAADDERLAGFRRRVQELDALLLTAVRRLPLALGFQNADLAARDHLRYAGDALSRWRADWTAALGMEGRKPRKLPPSQILLTETRETLSRVLSAADRELASAGERRAEILARLDRLEGPA